MCLLCAGLYLFAFFFLGGGGVRVFKDLGWVEIGVGGCGNCRWEFIGFQFGLGLDEFVLRIFEVGVRGNWQKVFGLGGV